MSAAPTSDRTSSTAPLLIGFALALGLPVGLLLLVVGLGVIGLALGLAIGAVATAVLVRGATGRILAANHAHLADASQHARLHNVAEGLCVALGLPVPALHVIDDPAANALVVGTDPRSAAVAVTSGLLDATDRMELEGVVALALTEIKADRLAVPTVAAALLGPFRSIGPVGDLLTRLGRGGSRIEADAVAVTLTRYPPGLLAALERIEATGTVVAQAPAATAHLWIAEPLAGPTSDDRPEASLDHRIAVLREL